MYLDNIVIEIHFQTSIKYINLYQSIQWKRLDAIVSSVVFWNMDFFPNSVLQRIE